MNRRLLAVLRMVRAVNRRRLALLAVPAVAWVTMGAKCDPIYHGAQDWRVAACYAVGGDARPYYATNYSYCSFAGRSYPSAQQREDVARMVAADWGLSLGFVWDFTNNIERETWVNA